MDNLDKIRIIEKELNRINKVIKNPDYNPIDVLDLTQPFTDTDVKKQYRKIVRLIHPDKTWKKDSVKHLQLLMNLIKHY
jgi:preprotein translocase subunit Sec63